MMGNLLLAVISAVICENFVFHQLFGLEAASDAKNSPSDVFVRTLMTAVFIIPASAGSFAVGQLLEGWGIGYLNVLIFALLLAVIEIGADVLLNKSARTSGLTAGNVKIFLNSAVFAAILSVSGCADMAESVRFGIICGAGFFVGSMIICGIRERLETADIPESFRGLPVLIIAAGLCAMIFTGFAGLPV